MRLLWGYGSLIICSVFIITLGNSEDDDWIDPYDMLNYDASSKSMKKPPEASSYSNVPTKRREYSSSLDAQCPDITECTSKVDRLQREIEEHKQSMSFTSQKPTCFPVFRRFLSKLLKEISKIGLPTDVNPDVHYDAEVKLSKQMVAEIHKLLNEDSSWRTGALDDALSQMLINFKLHDYEAWKWRFEDTFSVELETVIKVLLLVLVIVGIICTEMWSSVSWFLQFKRMFAICFFISIVWNWFYLYKIAFAESQAKIVKMENVNEKCTGLKKMDWKDNLKEWYRTTWTLQDDPCRQYYEVLGVDPILLVPPTKAITMTITTFITDPLKQVGQGISEFLRALLKDLPVTLQIPVLITIVLAIVVFMYGSAQAAIQHVVFRPLRGRRQDPPPPAVQQPRAPPLRDLDREEEEDHWGGGDAGRDPPPRQLEGHEGNRVNRMGHRPHEDYHRPEVRQRRPHRPREEKKRVYVETLRNADSLYSGDETDTLQGAAAEDTAPQPTANEPQADGAKQENKTSAENSTEQKRSQPAAEGQGSNVDNTSLGDNQRNDVDPSATVLDSSHNEEYVETLGTPVQETLQ
ncbi:chloride channel CLIC-like protein 1 isoform X1 [Astyanax mexicanus]|uniref:chloride channel CLIC-like protein 1 isoform X1 n=1 Tax=Astyanax mexicanus TaxID=7994 RepID=UPI0020CB405A|nr:chloride channel CLIC-like protein 1 isoform X1 [Astyanax mexicanus]